MYCLKCGRDTESAQVFCDACLECMSQFPVKPDTVVTLPHREAAPAAKKQPPRKRPLSPEEQVVLLRKHLRRMFFALVVLTLMLSLATAMLLQVYFGNPADPAIGRNYTITTSQQP